MTWAVLLTPNPLVAITYWYRRLAWWKLTKRDYILNLSVLFLQIYRRSWYVACFIFGIATSCLLPASAQSRPLFPNLNWLMAKIKVLRHFSILRPQTQNKTQSELSRASTQQQRSWQPTNQAQDADFVSRAKLFMSSFARDLAHI